MCFDIGIVTCGPNEALVISGVCYGNKPCIIVGGRAIVMPCLQTVQRIPLCTMTLVIESPRVYTSQGVPISVTGIAQVKINGSNEDMVRNAAEQFGSKDQDEISYIARETLEGHQRAIMGTLTVEEIYRDRKQFSSRVFEVASSDFVDMGLAVISYTIKDISDEVGYLEALGRARTAEVQRDARIGQAEASMAAGIETAKAEMQVQESKFANETEIARAKRDFDVTKAAYDVEVNTAKAHAQLAFQLQAATMQQKIKEQETEVAVVERKQEIEIAEQEIARREMELDANLMKPAAAEKFRLEKLAEAEKKKVVLQAEAYAQSIALRGEAEAYATEMKAKAEAEQMKMKAAAMQEFREAAMIEMVLDSIPKMISEISQPLSNVSKIKMVSDSDCEIGASRLSKEVLNIASSIPTFMQQMTGVDITSAIKDATTSVN